MDYVDRTLEMSISWEILIVATGRAVVRKAQSMPVGEVHIQKPLICSIKADTPLRKCK